MSYDVAIGSAVSGALNYLGTQSANRANERMARENRDWQGVQNQKAMDFTRESADTQMGFQERMSNTAYQRSMEDMKKAGLNPILAYNQGGASAPPGAGGAGVTSSGSVATAQNKLGHIASSAMDFKRASQELKNMQEQNKNMQIERLATNNRAELDRRLATSAEEQALLTKANTAKSHMETKLMLSDNIRKWADTINPLKLFKR